MDSMSGCGICLVFTFPPKDSTLEYKKCVHLWNNFPCISTLGRRENCREEEWMMHDYNEMFTELETFLDLDIHDSIIFFGLTKPILLFVAWTTIFLIASIAVV